MSLTRFTLCLGLLILLTGVTASARQDQKVLSPDTSFVGIPKGGAGIYETDEEVIVYDQGRGKGKIISKTTTRDGVPVMNEFVIK